MPEQLHIAILADFPRHSTGGKTEGRGGGHGATWLPPLADQFMAHRDLKISWVTFDHLVKRTEIDTEGNQQFIRIPRVNVKLNLAMGQLPARRRLRRTLKRLEPDLVHAWGTEWPYAAVLQDIQMPKVLSVQGCLTAFNRTWEPTWVHRRLEDAEAYRVREADIVTCESLWCAEQIQALSKDADIRIVDYGVHASFSRVSWDPDPSEPALVFSGSLDYRKGLDVLFDALELIDDRKWTLRICGHGPMEQTLRARNLSKVDWLGTLRWNEMQQVLSKSWGLVVPTRADTGPTVVKEARVMGLPVIGTRHGGLRDYIRDGKNGYIADPLEAGVLAEACEKLMCSRDHCLELGRQGHESDVEAFSPSLTASRFKAIYRELAQIR